MVRPEPSDKLPCLEDKDYSQNWCYVEHGWEQRFKELEEHYGDKFACKLPGIWIGDSNDKPVCSHYQSQDSPNGYLGFFDLLRDNKDKTVPQLMAPPIGIYKESSGCLPRCKRYTYTLISEEISEYDNDMTHSDLYLYFPSLSVEVWTEYRLQSSLDFVIGIGGAVGLILGMSLLSVVVDFIKCMKFGVEQFRQYLKEGRKAQQAGGKKRKVTGRH